MMRLLKAHCIGSVEKNKGQLIIGGFLLLTVLLLSIIPCINPEDTVFAVWCGCVASIIATIFCKIVDDIQMSWQSQKEVLQVANEFCQDVVGSINTDDIQVSKDDIVIDLHAQLIGLQRLYPYLLSKECYHDIVKRMHRIWKAFHNIESDEVVKEEIKEEIKNLQIVLINYGYKEA